MRTGIIFVATNCLVATVCGSALLVDHRAEILSALTDKQSIESSDISEIEKANDPLITSWFHPRVDSGEGPWHSGFKQDLEPLMPVLISVFNSDYDQRTLYLIKAVNDRPDWFALGYLAISNLRDIVPDFLIAYKNPITQDLSRLLMNIIGIAFSPEMEMLYRTWNDQHEIPDDIDSPYLSFQSFLKLSSLDHFGIEILPGLSAQITTALDSATIEDLLPAMTSQERLLVGNVPIEKWTDFTALFPMFIDESLFRLLATGSNPRAALFLFKWFRDLEGGTRRDFTQYRFIKNKDNEVFFWLKRMRLSSLVESSDWHQTFGDFLTSLWHTNRGDEAHVTVFRRCTGLGSDEEFNVFEFHKKLLAQKYASPIVDEFYRPLVNAILTGEISLPLESLDHSIAMTLFMARMARSPAAYFGRLEDIEAFKFDVHADKMAEREAARGGAAVESRSSAHADDSEK